jgi:hypothetical protein
VKGLSIVLLTLLAASCDTVDLGPTPPEVNACRPSPAFFVSQVWPNFLNKDYGGKRCSDSGCHNSSSGRQLVLTPPTSPGTVPLPADWAMIYRSVSEQMSCTNVSSSPLLVRTDGRQTHGGNKLIEPDGPEATLVKMWVTAQ